MTFEYLNKKNVRVIYFYFYPFSWGSYIENKSEYMNKTKNSKHSLVCYIFTWRSEIEKRANIWTKINSSKHSFACYVFTWRSEIEKTSECLNKNQDPKIFPRLLYLHTPIIYWNEERISEQKPTLQNISSFIISSYDDQIWKWIVNI
jgi:hypothetical protein